jgi:diguanylate cyclase (GGDEF)-like protein/PAS domain S-box-containing protein
MILMSKKDGSVIPSEAFIDIARRISHMGGWVADLTTQRVAWCDETCRILDVPEGTNVSLKDAHDFFTNRWRLVIGNLFATCVHHGMPFDEELEITTAKGHSVWVRMIGEAVRDDFGKVIRVQGAVQDNSDKKRADLNAARLSSRLSVVLESVTDAFLMVDRDWNFSYLNHEAERLLGYKREDVLGTNLWAKFPQAIGGPYYKKYYKAVRENRSVASEEYYPPRNIWIEIRAYPSDEGLAIYFLDISERKKAEEKIHQLAFYDSLTGLPNRQLLMNRLTHFLQLSKRTGCFGTVMYIDLDHFKTINDTRGHDKGDALLQQVAERLLCSLRTSDTLARMGGDEFVVLLEDSASSEESALMHAKQVTENILAAFHHPFEVADSEYHTTASVGVTAFNGEAVTATEVLKHADLALYEAKAAGRNNACFFEKEIEAYVNEQATLKTALRHAVMQEEFLLHYQPQVDLFGKIIGVEALVRWNHPIRGLVSPVEFIALAEETGLIVPLGEWVLTAACRQIARWAESPKTENLTIAVNISAQELHRRDFVDRVLRVLEETQADPKCLKLEVTESLLIQDIEGTILKMHALKAYGIRFSLDDFGTGYSSLAYLHRLPLEELKIDRSFIREAVTKQHSATIARSIVALGKALNLTVVAEGVETPDQYKFIAGEGCTGYQGYLFSKPLTYEAICELVLAA